jgi:pantetheine-phosphate adenylyltransferase
METLLIPASAEWLGVSSSAVREIASFGGDIREYVPECICREIRKWLNPAEAAE